LIKQNMKSSARQVT